nr:MAG TPA: hypothetical protein [Caudoviricetes sp.]
MFIMPLYLLYLLLMKLSTAERDIRASKKRMYLGTSSFYLIRDFQSF